MIWVAHRLDVLFGTSVPSSYVFQEPAGSLMFAFGFMGSLLNAVGHKVSLFLPFSPPFLSSTLYISMCPSLTLSVTRSLFLYLSLPSLSSPLYLYVSLSLSCCPLSLFTDQPL